MCAYVQLMIKEEFIAMLLFLLLLCSVYITTETEHSFLVSLCISLLPPIPSLPQLVGGQFDLEMNFIIQEAESIGCMVELLSHCEVTCQAEIWSMFTAILRKSVRNLQTSTEVGLIQQVLLKMSTVDDMIAGNCVNEHIVTYTQTMTDNRYGRVRSINWYEVRLNCRRFGSDLENCDAKSAKN